MMEIIIITVWFTGSVFSYFITRRYWKSLDEWTIGDRYFALFLSVFSWFSVLGGVMSSFVKKCNEDDRPANW